MKSISPPFGPLFARVWLVGLWLGLAAPRALSADGHLGIVIGSPGKIMAESKVLAEVPRGTRLWVFNEKPGWAEVKLPGKEEHGWISNTGFSKTQLTAQQTKVIDQAQAYFKQYEAQINNIDTSPAKASLEKCLQLELSVYGADHPEVANTKSHLASIYHSQFEPQPANKLYAEALQVYRQAYGNEHPDVALMLSSLGACASLSGELPQAIKYYQESLEIYRRLKASTEIADVLSDLGDALYGNGDLPPARKAYLEALAMKPGQFENEIIDLTPNANLLFKLGQVASEQREHQDAHKYFNEALAIYRNNLFGDSARCANTLEVLGIDAVRQRNFVAARKYYDEALDTLQKAALDSKDGYFASVCQNIAALEIEQKNYRAAKLRLLQALEFYDKVLPQSTLAAKVLQSLGNVSLELGNQLEARRYYEQALEIRSKELGAAHADTKSSAESVRKLAVLGTDLAQIDPLPAKPKLTDLEELAFDPLAVKNYLDSAPVVPPALPPNPEKATTPAPVLQPQAPQPAAQAVEEFLATVTGTPGKIMDGSKVLAELPVGTRLWVFNTKPGWVEVKVPQQERHGWMAATNVQKEQYTPEQLAQLKKVADLRVEAKKQEAAKEWVKARQSWEEALRIETSVRGSDHPWVSASQNNLAVFLTGRGDFVPAEKLLEEALAIRRKMNGLDNFGAATVFNNLGLAKLKLKDHAAARTYMEQGVALVRKHAEEPGKTLPVPLSNLGDALYASNKFVEAREQHAEALALRRKVLGNEHSEVAANLGSLANDVSQVGDYRAAITYLTEALSIQRKLHGDKHLATAFTLSTLGSMAHNLGDYAAMERYIREAREIRRELLGTKHPDYAATIIQFGKLAAAQGKTAAASEHYQEALDIHRQANPESLGVASALTLVAAFKIENQDFAGAKKLHEESLALRRKLLGDEHWMIAEVLVEMGSLAMKQADFATAKEHLEKAVAIRRKLFGDDNLSVSYALNELGKLAQEQSNFAAAKKQFDQALAIQAKLLGEEHLNVALTKYYLGSLALAQSDYPTARANFDEVLRLRRKILGPRHHMTAQAESAIGNLTMKLGDYETSRQSLLKAMEIYREVYGERHPTVANILNTLGIVAMYEKRFPEARRLLNEALAMDRTFFGEEHAIIANRYNNLARVAEEERDYDTARKHYDQALPIMRKVYKNDNPTFAHALNNVGRLARLQGDYAEAYKNLDEALQMRRRMFGKDHPLTCDSLADLALLAVAEQEFDQAQQRWDEVRRIRRRYTQYLLPALSAGEQLQFLDQIFQRDWHTSLSYGWLRRTDTAIVNLSAGWLLNGKAIAQESLAERELLARDLSNPELAPLVRELQSVRQQLASLALSAAQPGEDSAQQAALTKLAGEEYRLAQTLAQKTGQAMTSRDWIELQTLRRALPPGSVYVDFVRLTVDSFAAKPDPEAAAHYLAWVIPAHGKGQIQLLDLGPAESLDALVQQARESLAKASAAESLLKKEGERAATVQANKDLQAVAAAALQPLLPALGETKQLILSPDGALWLLPWSALPWGEDKCLLEQCSLRFVLSGRDLIKASNRNKLPPNAPAIFANPDFDLAGAAAKSAIKALFPQAKFEDTEALTQVSRSTLPRVKPLPFTEYEGEAARPILQKLTKLEPQAYQQGKALEAAAKLLKRPQYLLFATHGFFLPDQVSRKRDEQLVASSESRSVPALTAEGKQLENPLLRCGLLFAGCNAPRTPGLDDGILTGLEIVGMDLRGTELVVLSACETGIGKVRNGEGVAGLRQAFQLAGAQSVVSTLWQVPDRDSALIMQDFFTNLAAGQTKADALRNAQLKRITARKEKSGAAHPFFWAAWTVTGE